MAAMAVSNSGVLGGIQRDVSFPALLGTILIMQALHHSIYLRLQAKHVLKASCQGSFDVVLGTE